MKVFLAPGFYKNIKRSVMDGVSIPIEISRLNDPNLTDSLREYTPKQLIREISQFSEILSS